MDERRHIHEAVKKVSAGWAVEFIRQRKAALERKGIKGSGALIEGLEFATEEQAEALVSRILVAFPGYGRIAEMRRVSHDAWGRNAIDRVVDWITAKGVGKFLPGFMKKYNFKKPPQDAVLRMAWGVLVARSQGKFRRRKWYNAAKTAAITDLYNDVAIATMDATADSVKSSFNAKQYARIRGRE
jgi:hypothetical protein